MPPLEPIQLLPMTPERDGTRAGLLSALGIAEGESAEAYMHYIESAWTYQGEWNDFLHLFIDVVHHFHVPSTSQTAQPRIQAYIDGLVNSQTHAYFKDTVAGSGARITGVTEAVLRILGAWLLMHSYFIPTRRDQRRVVFAYCVRQKHGYSEQKALNEPVPRLLSQSGLLPNAYEINGSELNSLPDSSTDRIMEPFGLHDSVGLLESLSVNPKKLNAVRLSRLGGIKFTWTTNISRHLLLSKHGETNYLDLFALPCALQGDAASILADMGISTELIDEIESSYATLFNPITPSYLHTKLAKIRGFCYLCWCLHCGSYRLRKRVLRALNPPRGKDPARYQFKYDPTLETLMKRNATQWDQTEFKQLWPRISVLDAHLQQTRPWNFWVLFRDSRDTVQYWTFLFGSIILFLTVVQVILGAAQVASGFLPQS
ncbi:hypothetical protein AUP68_00735 [Ilyonectria robusta]